MALRRWQSEALAAVRAAVRDGSTAPLVQACTGAGKSVFLAELAAQARGPVLVTTPTQALVDQLHGTLTARGLRVGRYYQHAEEPDAPVVVCCHASLPRLLALGRRWGLWLADEAHRLSGADLPVQRSLAVGLTATPDRRAGGRGAGAGRRVGGDDRGRLGGRRGRAPRGAGAAVPGAGVVGGARRACAVARGAGEGAVIPARRKHHE